MTTVPTDTTGRAVIPSLINRLAEIDDELDRLGVNRLLAERENTRKRLKDTMTDAGLIEALDEASGYRAVIKDTHTDTWPNLKKLVEALPRAEMADEVLETVVNAKAIEKLVTGGLLTRSRLEQSGALVRVLRSRALYVEPMRADRRVS